MPLKLSGSRPAENVTLLLAGIALAGGVAGAATLARRKKEQRQGDDAPGRTARRSFGDYDVISHTETIARPRQELFAFWRDFQNLPRFMENIEKVEPTGQNGRAVWTIKAPGWRTVRVETEIAREEDGYLIAWRSIPQSEIDTEGRVTFEDAPGNRGTRVTALIAYKPPAGMLGKAVAKLFLREPAMQARHDLKRLKMLMEAGEIATSARTREDTRAAKEAERWRSEEEV